MLKIIHIAAGMGLALALGSASLQASPGRAAGKAPVCPERDDLVRTFVPDYIRQGRTVVFSFERQRLSIKAVNVTYPTKRGRQTERFGFPDGRDRVKVLRPAAGKPRRVRIGFRWRQDVGQPNECRGVDVHKGIPLVGRHTHVGDPDRSRFGGRYRATYHGYPDATWRLRPRCVFFACKSRVRSSGGLKGKFLLRARNRYTIYSKQFNGHCVTTNRFTGAQHRYRMYEAVRIFLRVTREKNGIATRLRGRWTRNAYTVGDPFDTCEDIERDRANTITVKRRAK